MSDLYPVSISLAVSSTFSLSQFLQSKEISVSIRNLLIVSIIFSLLVHSFIPCKLVQIFNMLLVK